MAEPKFTLRCLEFNDGPSCFDNLTTEENQELLKYRVEVRFKKGETICKQGSFASSVFFIKKGLIKIVLENNHSGILLKLKTVGKLVGLPSVYGNNIFHYSAIAVIDTTVCMIDINYIRDLMHRNINFANAVVHVLTENLVMNYDRLTCLTQKRLHGRLADILLCLYYKIYNSPNFEMNISRKELADLSGMSIESLARVLKDLSDDEIIDIDGKAVKIINLPKLKEISEKG